MLPLFADPTGVIRGPAGEGRVAAVARADVADVAVAVLRDPAGHVGATYTADRAGGLTMAEVAARAGAVLGRELRFEDETVEEAYASRAAAYDVERWQLDAWVSTYTAIADGSCAEVTDDVRRSPATPPGRWRTRCADRALGGTLTGATGQLGALATPQHRDLAVAGTLRHDRVLPSARSALSLGVSLFGQKGTHTADVWSVSPSIRHPTRCLPVLAVGIAWPACP